MMVRPADIKGFGLFTGLDEPELEAVARLASRRNYPANTVITAPDTCAADVLLLEDGNEAIQMEIPLKDGGPRVVIHTLSKGEVFCWTPLCPAHTRAATARVIKPAAVISIDGPGLQQLLAENEHAGCQIMKNLACILSARLSYITLVFSHEIEKSRKLLAV